MNKKKNHKTFFKLSAILPIIIALIISAILFWLGEIEDAPGLHLIGTSIGFLLILWGFCNAGLIKKSQLAHIILLCFGIGLLILSVTLQLDGEFEGKPLAFFVGLSLGAITVSIGVLNWIKYRQIKTDK